MHVTHVSGVFPVSHVCVCATHVLCCITRVQRITSYVCLRAATAVDAENLIAFGHPPVLPRSEVLVNVRKTAKPC